MRFGVIGVGNIGYINVKALKSLPEVEIVAVANRTVSKAKEFCEKNGAELPCLFRLSADAGQRKTGSGAD